MTMNIGFDLDKVFVDYPPFIPSWVIDRLYRKKTEGALLYRMPGSLEKKIRIASHAPLLRPILQDNLQFLLQLKQSPSQHLFLISSRFSFLKERTDSLIRKYQLNKVFSHMYFNYQNMQPHLFKEQILKKHQLDKYIDDDLPLLRFLAKKYPKTNFYWLNPRFKKKLATNIFAITHISEIN